MKILLLLLSLAFTLSAQEPRKFGWLGDSGQKRVLMLAPHQWAKTVPDAKSDLTDGLPAVLNQGQLGSCVAQGVAVAWSYAHNAQTGDHLPVSRLMIYYEARKAIGTVNQDSGSQIVDAVNWMSRWGSCKEPLWPYDISKFKLKAPNAAYSEAKSHRAIQAFKVDNTDRQSIRLALSNGYPVVVGSLVYSGIMQLNSRNYTLPMPGRGERPIGGHCYIICGHDDRTRLYRARNSWGRGFGQRGDFLVPYDYIHSGRITEDCWVCASVSTP